MLTQCEENLRGRYSGVPVANLELEYDSGTIPNMFTFSHFLQSHAVGVSTAQSKFNL